MLRVQEAEEQNGPLGLLISPLLCPQGTKHKSSWTKSFLILSAATSGWAVSPGYLESRDNTAGQTWELGSEQQVGVRIFCLCCNK